MNTPKKLRTLSLLSILVIGVAVGPALGQYEIPAGYYDTATGVGLTLKGQLHNIIDDHRVQEYEIGNINLQILDEDPNNSENIILIYNGASVLNNWDAGATWNKEHQWPRSRGINTTGPDNTDMINLRPCNPSINGSRSNLPFGIGGGFWDPDLNAFASDRGDCARAMFYMAVRYDGSDFNTEDLELTNGLPGTNQMGDLAKLIEWHYTDPVDAYERRRNHFVWSSVDNPNWFQGNRNPFIDHPEYVWTIWGTSDNDSTVYVGDTVAGDGGSTELIEFRVIVNTTPDSQSVALNKTGATPTTYDVVASGDIQITNEGTRQTFTTGSQGTSIEVSFTQVSTVGAFAGSVIVDNTDLTSAAAGQGSADANDAIVVSADVLDHSEASFDDAVDTNTAMVDFGTVETGSGIQNADVSIYNLQSLAGLTATLSVDSVGGVGDMGVLFTDLAPFDDLAAGDAHVVTVSFDGDAAVGSYAATYTIDVSDEDVPGGLSGDTLTLTVVGEVVAPPPCPMACGDLDSSGGIVNLQDFATFALCFGSVPSAPGCFCSDMNSDGAINLLDFATFTLTFGGVSTNTHPNCP